MPLELEKVKVKLGANACAGVIVIGLAIHAASLVPAGLAAPLGQVIKLCVVGLINAAEKVWVLSDVTFCIIDLDVAWLLFKSFIVTEVSSLPASAAARLAKLQVTFAGLLTPA